jgi:iron-sulfur cluster assembly protein
MSISITPRAAKRIEEIREAQQIATNVPLRVSVESGGCSGLTYKLDFDAGSASGAGSAPAEGSASGTTSGPGEQRFTFDGLEIVVDMRSFLYLAGTELDYTDGLEGQGFHFANPNAARTCSCGESFSL